MGYILLKSDRRETTAVLPHDIRFMSDKKCECTIHCRRAKEITINTVAKSYWSYGNICSKSHTKLSVPEPNKKRESCSRLKLGI